MTSPEGGCRWEAQRKACRVLDSQVRRQRPAPLREGEQSGRSRLLNEKHLFGESRLASADARLARKSARQDASGMERAGVRDRLGVRQCQRTFRQSGFRLGKPGPAIGHADPERQKTQKKNSKARRKKPAVYRRGNEK